MPICEKINKDRETMELTEATLTELKKIEIAMLREFVNVCDQLKLRYYLLGGTLLGAVRHQGFIPWDDDIDVGMLREDYEIFLQKGAALLPEHLFIQTNQSDPGYVHCFAKIRNSNTTFVEISARKMNIHHGVFIDIFPLDFYPDDAGERRKFDWSRKWYEHRISVVFDLPGNYTLKGVVKKCLTKILLPSLQAAIEKRDALYQKVPVSSMIANYGGAWGKKEIVPASWYGKGAKVMFEGMELSAPAEYDKWLTQVYGDYMQLPPVEKRVGHHYVEAADLHAPYTQYMRNRK